MLDKVWYDWQNRDPNNKYAFKGGSVSWQVNQNQSFDEYPNGSPPWLDVRGDPPSLCEGPTLNVRQMKSVIPNDGLWYYNYTVDDIIDTTGGKLCYTYA